MAGIEVTIDRAEIQRLLRGDGGLAELLERVLKQVLEAELTEHVGAEPHERTSERRGRRNGHYRRCLTTRVGTLELEVPRDREGRFRTELFERYQRSEKALVLALMEMVVNGVSTRKVKRVTRELCGRDRIFKAEDPEAARAAFGTLCEELEGEADAALDTLERGLEDAIAVLALPDRYRRRLRTTNMLERLIQEARRREKVIRIFPDERSAWRLLGALLAEQHEIWVTGRRWLSMDEFWDWKRARDGEDMERAA